MPFLDVIQLFFKPAATIEEASSVFGKEWLTTLQYVLHQNGLDDAYVSSMTDERSLFVFLVWASGDARTHFYHQTAGFGFLNERMWKTPSVFFFGDDNYAKLAKTEEWTIDILSTQSRDAVDVQHMFEVQEKLSFGSSDQSMFVARQHRADFKKLYEGNSFDHALISIITTISDIGPAPTSDFKHKRYKANLRRCNKNPYLEPSTTTIEAPMNVADLTSKQPWEYGVLSSDEGEFRDTAYPMNLSFRPMSTLHMADGFLPERRPGTFLDSNATDQYTMCIISVTPQLVTGSQSNGKSFVDLQEKLGLHHGHGGLLEISVLRPTARSDESEFVRLTCTWSTIGDLTKWWQDFTASAKDGSGTNIKIDYTWSSERVGWPDLEWDNMPLTCDKQHWQKVDKVLEVVEFSFIHDLTATEKMAFQEHVHDLMNTMSSCWSGDIDERPVVHAETPVWTTKEDAPSAFLLFFAWDGTEQRRAWLLNFIANDFEWTGHIAHTLGIICSSVRSQSYEMEQMYARQETRGTSVDCNLDDDDSDRDMGF